MDQVTKVINMKIAIPTDEPSIEGNLFNKFGRAPYFLFYDTNTKKTKFVENKSVQSSSGAGSQTAQTLIKEGINTVIIDTIGPKAKNLLERAGVIIFEGIKGSIVINMANFDSDDLTPEV